MNSIERNQVMDIFKMCSVMDHPLAKEKKKELFKASYLIGTATRGYEEDTPDDVRFFVRFLLDGLRGILDTAYHDAVLMSPDEGYEKWRDTFLDYVTNGDY